jgi:hypothetical protein
MRLFKIRDLKYQSGERKRTLEGRIGEIQAVKISALIAFIENMM